MPMSWLKRRRAHDQGEHALPTTPRALRRWLAAAERLEPRELSHRLLETVRALNARELAPRERLRLLELMRPGARKALDYLGGRIHAQALPLPAAARAAYEIDLGLLGELAAGYEQALLADEAGLRRRSAPLAAERALALSGERMLRAAQTYSPLDEGFWQRVNAIQRRTERLACTERPVRDDELRFAERGRQSPGAMFKRLLLFHLAGTNGFRRGEARRLYRALEGWADLARLAPPGGSSPNLMPRFAIDLDGTDPPRLLEETGHGSGVYVLEVDELVHHVEQLRVAAGPEDNPVPAENELGAAALARLIDGWRPGNYRRSERASRGSEVDAEVTLNLIHTRIAMETVPPPEEQPPAETTPDWTLEPVHDDHSGSGSLRHDGVRPGVNWNDVPRGRQPSAAYEAAREAEARTARRESERGTPRWLLEDVSATGFRLIWDGEGSCRVAVGELVALRLARSTGDRGRWCVGVVRRMRFVDERRFEIGVQALSRNALAARIREEPANPNTMRFRDSETSAPALLLPAEKSRGTPTTLLVPAHMFRGGEIVEIDLHDRVLRLRLGALSENTGAFSRHELAPAPERGRHAPSDMRFADALQGAAN